MERCDGLLSIDNAGLTEQALEPLTIRSRELLKATNAEVRIVLSLMSTEISWWKHIKFKYMMSGLKHSTHWSGKTTWFCIKCKNVEV